MGLVSRPTATAAAEPSDREKATAMLAEGAELYRKGDVTRALGNFKAAYAVFPSPKLQYNIGLAYQGLGRHAEALKSFEAFLRDAPDAPAERLADARDRIRQLAAKVANLAVTGPREGAEVLVDGALVGRTPLPARLPIDSGRHELVVRSSTGSRTRTFTAIAGRAIELKVDLPAGGAGATTSAAGDGAPDTASGPATAEALIAEATELRRAGRHSKAYPLLSRAYAVQTSARTAAQLGLVEMQLGYWLDSERHLSEGLASARDPWITEHRDDLESSLARVKAAIGDLVLLQAPPGSLVLVNGRPAGTIPLAAPIRVGEGPVNLEVRPPGQASRFRSLIMLGGQRQEVAFGANTSAVSDASAPTAQRAPMRDDPPGDAGAARSYSRMLAWTATGLAAGALGVGVWQTLAWKDRRRAFESYRAPAGTAGARSCGVDDPNRGAAPCAGIYDDFTRARATAIASLVAVGALGAAAATLFVISPGAGGSTAHIGRATVHIGGGTVDVACAPSGILSGGICGLTF